jgi:hypothetical protein
MNIYQIDAAIQACLDMDTDELVDMETGEIISLDALQMEREKKLENVACYIKNLTADADALKAEKDALAKREQAARKKIDSLKKYLTDNLHGEKLTTTRAAISFRKSEAVEFANQELFVVWAAENMNSLLTYKQPEPNKTVVKQYLKAGGTLPGAQLVERLNVAIK